MSFTKLGVEVEVPKEKLGSAQIACPSCGGVLVFNSNVPACHICGTEPFEGTPTNDPKR